MNRSQFTLSQEIEDLIIADAALSIGFSFVLSRGFGSELSACSGAVDILKLLCSNSFLFYLPIAFVAVSLSFILHEYMHKIVAQRYGAPAAFKRWDLGILLAIVSGWLGFLIGSVGATWIYTNSFTRKQDGLTSLAGPLTNFVVFIIFFTIWIFLPRSYANGYIGVMVGETLFISLWLAVFNMLPIYPLDGSKVWRWNKPVYLVTFVGLVILLLFVLGVI
jgi:Zn-dependent protease